MCGGIKDIFSKSVEKKIEEKPDFIQKTKNYLNRHIDALNLKDKNKTALKDAACRIIDFINNNQSIIFFGLTVIFAYFMTPLSSFEYFTKLSTIKEVFIKGTLLGSAVFIAKNTFGMKPLSKAQDDKINYLSGIANIAETYLDPAQGLISAAATSGFIAIKTLFEKMFPSDARDIYFLIPDNKA